DLGFGQEPHALLGALASGTTTPGAQAPRGVARLAARSRQIARSRGCVVKLARSRNSEAADSTTAPRRPARRASCPVRQYTNARLRSWQGGMGCGSPLRAIRKLTFSQYMLI